MTECPYYRKCKPLLVKHYRVRCMFVEGKGCAFMREDGYFDYP